MATSSVTPIPASMPTPPVGDGMRHGANYAFFLRDNTPGLTYPTYYGDILSSVSNKVCIWDPYFHKDDAVLFDKLPATIGEIIILSSKTNRKKNEYIQGIIDETRNHIPTAAVGNCTITVAFIDTDSHGLDEWHTHDRFLIVDDSEYYLIGSSAEFHRRLRQSTGIYHITENADKQVIQDAFNQTFAVSQADRMYKTETL